MHRYPHLCVANIVNIRLNRAGASAFYSVLLKKVALCSTKADILILISL